MEEVKRANVEDERKEKEHLAKMEQEYADQKKKRDEEIRAEIERKRKEEIEKNRTMQASNSSTSNIVGQ